MEDLSTQVDAPDEQFERLAESLAVARSRAAETLAAYRDELDETQSHLAAPIQELIDGLAKQRDRLEAERQALRADAEAIVVQQQEVEARQAHLQQEQVEVAASAAAQEEHLERLAEQLAEREQTLLETAKRLEQGRQDLEEESAELGRSKERLLAKQRAVEEQRDRLSQQNADTKSQRRQIARQFKKQRAELMAEIERGRQEIAAAAESENKELAVLTQDHEALRNQLAELDKQHRSAQEQLAATASEVAQAKESAERTNAEIDAVRRENAELATLVDEAADLENRLNALQIQYQSAVDTNGSTRVELDQAHAQAATAMAELEQLQQAHAQLRENAQASEHLADELAQQKQQLQELTDQLESAGAEIEKAHRQRQQALDKAELAVAEARQVRQENAELAERIAEQPSGASPADLLRAQAERDALAEQLAEAQAQLARPTVDPAAQDKIHDLQRRFELAVEDVRDLKLRNAELEEELATAQFASRVRGETPGVNLDWEAQKKKLLASLEEDFDAQDEDDLRDRLTVEGTIQITDEIVAGKQREIEELQRLLAAQSSSHDGIAVGAAAIANYLDDDELIREERRRLSKIQAEWEEKLRQAEIDISVERAQIARDKADLEEKTRTLEARLAKLPPAGGGASGEEAAPVRRRWLSRLGLTDEDQE